CFKCGGQGHMARDCPNEERQRPCHLCGQFGHTRYQCSNTLLCIHCRAEGGCTGEYLEGDLRQALCVACGRRGHLCCQLAEGLPPRKTSCYNCGEGGHVAEDC
ncbi:hypothetical protein COCSUDRAFT_10924, partial [Coccomyxa subellipsoidea C-169]